VQLERQATALPPDPNNAALLYYQAFLCQPETNYAEEQLVYNNRAEKIYDLLCGGELEIDPDIDKKIQELENRLKNDSNEPDEIPPEIRELMPEGFLTVEYSSDFLSCVNVVNTNRRCEASILMRLSGII